MSTTSSAKNELFADNTRVLNGTARAIWHESAPKAVRRAFAAGDHAEGWAAWKKHLAGRKKPADLNGLLPGACNPLTWGLPDGLDSSPKPSWLDHAKRLSADGRAVDPALEWGLLGWLGESAGSVLQPGYARDALACAHAIIRLTAVLSPEAWWPLLDHLLAAVADAGAIELEDDPLAHQLLAGELALTLAYLLPELTPCRKLKPAARRALSRGPIDLLDGEGLPHAKHLALTRPLLACWTRCLALGDQLKGGCWNASADEQYDWFLRHALRLARHDGGHVFSNGAAGDASAELFQAALHFGGDDEDEEIAAVVLPRRKRRGRRNVDHLKLPDAATHSEWAATAVLRPVWSRSGERLTVVYAGQSVRMEFGCGKEVLWSGTWGLEVRIDGEPAVPTSDWEQVCWVSDRDADFLELEIEFGGGLRVQRQMLLARKDHFLLLTDVLLGKETSHEGSGRLEYRGRLPLCPGISFQGADETREGFLVGGKRRALVLPLALPEWRSQPGVGELLQTGRGLELRQSTDLGSLHAPLFLDLDRRRRRQRVTWRQLTVAESLAIQPADVAVGYRVAVGKQQWLIYRSLAEKANRTLLGHNLSTEMLVARFHHCGEVKPLVEIE